MSDQPTPELGLRERKRRETRLRIEDEATRLFLEAPFADVTVEDICQAVDISRRTFFNYFTSKDHVAVGKLPQPLTDEQYHQIEGLDVPENSSLAAEVLSIVANHRVRQEGCDSAGTSVDPALAQRIANRRVEILNSNPDLALAKLASYEKVRARLGAALTANLHTHPANRVAADRCSAEEEALMIVTAVTTVLWSGAHMGQLRGQPDFSVDALTTGYEVISRIFGTLPDTLTVNPCNEGGTQ
ncbi:MAG TPA: TetR/AcrR family transcriptional regulator [Candidatus Corynebacterium gallistercoris]|uniref:TetR/AcrR family transcriptional regulator n=1 Tax=Candidatus Corynebacterium gallistercoris TaxID=2838530 RepID=A0A9D1S031_9CORY|nr:TetR/AcrR family transcriptional regulator [Candidatus Corynebacterium gallistercoris]